MLEKSAEDLSLRRQCNLLSLSRSALYYKPRGKSAENLKLMSVIDEEFTRHPFLGVASMTAYLRDIGHACGPKRVRRLLRRMGLEAIYPKPKTSLANKQQEVYPYLLRDVEITRANQVWATDITYIRLRHGFAYLVAVMDWHSRENWGRSLLVYFIDGKSIVF